MIEAIYDRFPLWKDGKGAKAIILELHALGMESSGLHQRKLSAINPSINKILKVVHYPGVDSEHRLRAVMESQGVMVADMIALAMVHALQSDEPYRGIAALFVLAEKMNMDMDPLYSLESLVYNAIQTKLKYLLELSKKKKHDNESNADKDKYFTELSKMCYDLESGVFDKDEVCYIDEMLEEGDTKIIGEALHEAIRTFNEGLALYIIGKASKEVRWELNESGDTTLSSACLVGDSTALVEALIEGMPSEFFYVRNKRHMTCFEIAVIGWKKPIMDILLNCAPELKTMRNVDDMGDKKKFFPLWLCIHPSDITRDKLDYVLDGNSTPEYKFKIVEWEDGIYSVIKSICGANKFDEDLIYWFLNGAADTYKYQIFDDGTSVLSCLLQNDIQNLENFEEFVKNAPKEYLNPGKVSKMAPLCIAARNAKLEVVRILFKYFTEAKRDDKAKAVNFRNVLLEDAVVIGRPEVALFLMQEMGCDKPPLSTELTLFYFRCNKFGPSLDLLKMILDGMKRKPNSNTLLFVLLREHYKNDQFGKVFEVFKYFVNIRGGYNHISREWTPKSKMKIDFALNLKKNLEFMLVDISSNILFILDHAETVSESACGSDRNIPPSFWNPDLVAKEMASWSRDYKFWKASD